MQTLRIHAASPESARGLAEALKEFHAELIPMIDAATRCVSPEPAA